MLTVLFAICLSLSPGLVLSWLTITGGSYMAVLVSYPSDRFALISPQFVSATDLNAETDCIRLPACIGSLFSMHWLLA